LLVDGLHLRPEFYLSVDNRENFGVGLLDFVQDHFLQGFVPKLYNRRRAVVSLDAHPPIEQHRAPRILTSLIQQKPNQRRGLPDTPLGRLFPDAFLRLIIVLILQPGNQLQQYKIDPRDIQLLKPPNRILPNPIKILIDIFLELKLLIIALLKCKFSAQQKNRTFIADLPPVIEQLQTLTVKINTFSVNDAQEPTLGLGVLAFDPISIFVHCGPFDIG
jgi:hypothetical protein